MKLKWIVVGMVAAGFLCAQANPVLLDLNEETGTGNDGSVTDFTDLGITGDLAGASVSQILASTNSSMTDGTITLSYLSGAAQGLTSYTTNNGVLVDYLYIADGGNAGPVTMQMSGLSSLLSSDTEYYLYLIGAGDNTDQGSTFTFDSTTRQTTSGTETLSDTVAQFTFTTAATVADTLDFTWERTDDNTYGTLN
ncbi:MAG TPA: hypothetical protein VJ904_03450, partial [Tichowtungia sp.]|nr:hypothetical protein [Tichowtungia sp.]